MTKRTTAFLAAALAWLAVAGGTAAEAQSSRRAERPVAVLCSLEEVRTRNWNYAALEVKDESAVTSLKEECEAALATSTRPEPDLITDRPWTAFCSEAGLQRRHPNADNDLVRALREECRGAVQTIADAKQELTRCDYSSISQCGSDGCGPSVDPRADVRWLEIPPLNETLWRNNRIAQLGYGPYASVRRCYGTLGCDRIDVEVKADNVRVELKGRREPWHMTVSKGVPSVQFLWGEQNTFMEVSSVGLNTWVNYGNCPEVFAALR